MMEVKISTGNMKLGRLPNINLPPILTCAKDVPCAKECYALKAYNAYPNAKKAWDSNLSIYQENPNFYFSNIIDQLKKKKNPTKFRWHSSGDIVDR